MKIGNSSMHYKVFFKNLKQTFHKLMKKKILKTGEDLEGYNE